MSSAFSTTAADAAMLGKEFFDDLRNDGHPLGEYLSERIAVHEEQKNVGGGVSVPDALAAIACVGVDVLDGIEVLNLRGSDGGMVGIAAVEATEDDPGKPGWIGIRPERMVLAIEALVRGSLLATRAYAKESHMERVKKVTQELEEQLRWEAMKQKRKDKERRRAKKALRKKVEGKENPIAVDDDGDPGGNSSGNRPEAQHPDNDLATSQEDASQEEDETSGNKRKRKVRLDPDTGSSDQRKRTRTSSQSTSTRNSQPSEGGKTTSSGRSHGTQSSSGEEEESYQSNDPHEYSTAEYIDDDMARAIEQSYFAGRDPGLLVDADWTEKKVTLQEALEHFKSLDGTDLEMTAEEICSALGSIGT